MRERHISIGALDQRKQIEIDCNIWGTEALNFIAFPDNADVYKTGYWNGTGENVNCSNSLSVKTSLCRHVCNYLKSFLTFVSILSFFKEIFTLLLHKSLLLSLKF